MTTRALFITSLLFLMFATHLHGEPAMTQPRHTAVSIKGEKFLINGQPTHAGKTFNNQSIEGLLFNARLVQATFDDENPDTRKRWSYPDGTPYDADRNTREFIAALPEYKKHGLTGFTINLQGGSPQGYSQEPQVWINSAFNDDGSLKPAYMKRVEAVLDKADELGMIVILGYFYFGQAPRMKPDAIERAADNATEWLIAKKYTHVIIEIANETDHPKYAHPGLKPKAANILIERVQRRSQDKIATPAKRLLVSTSLMGGNLPTDAMVRSSDFILLHGNGVGDPQKISAMVQKVRKMSVYRGQPILFNEDDHFDFDKPTNNFLAAVEAGAGWGYFDYRMKGEGFDEGHQSIPVNWGISSNRKRGFFELLKKITGP